MTTKFGRIYLFYFIFSHVDICIIIFHRYLSANNFGTLIISYFPDNTLNMRIITVPKTLQYKTSLRMGYRTNSTEANYETRFLIMIVK